MARKPEPKKKYDQPDYIMRAMNKNTNVSADIGRGYIKENGRILLWFNPFLATPLGREMTVSLFPLPRGDASENRSTEASRFSGLDLEGPSYNPTDPFKCSDADDDE